MGEITLTKCQLCGAYYPADSTHKCNIIALRAYSRGKSDGRSEAVKDCIAVMKYCWYNGQQPLDVLVRRMEQLKEVNDNGNER